MRLTKEQNNTIKKYILDCIDPEAYEVEAKTDKEKLSFLFDTFKKEKGWEIERIGINNSFKDWLQGLPSCFHIEFQNHAILKLAISWGSLPKKPTEKQEDKILENYWNFMSVKTMQLIKKGR